jgi:monoamine oxidase
MASNETAVAVIGGGAAGVAAARRLFEAGVPAVIVEARNRLGGRAWTVTAAAGHPVDLGCGWLHSAEGNEWTRIAEAQGRAIDRSLPPWQRPSTGLDLTSDEQREFQAAMAAFFDRVSDAARRRPDIAAGDLFEPGGRWNALINSILTFISGADADRVSVCDLENYVDTEINWRVVDGYGTAIAAHGAGLPAVFDCPVRRIDHSGRRLRIETTRGVIEAERAIITLPTNVLAESENLFFPALPEKMQAARSLPLGVDDKLYLALDNPEEFARDTRLFGHTDRSTGAYTLHAFGRPQIECYYGGGLATDLERSGERAFFDFAIEELTGRLGADFARRVRPLALHRWGADPFARGSYSFALPGEADKRAVLAAPVDGRLFFAGEACSPHDFSTAHGAYRTGIAAAEAILAGAPGRR